MKLLLLLLPFTIGCGGGNFDDNQCRQFDATVNGRTIEVDGCGKDTLSQEYDAVAFVVSLYHIAVPVKVVISDRDNKTTDTFTVSFENNQMYINH